MLGFAMVVLGFVGNVGAAIQEDLPCERIVDPCELEAWVAVAQYRSQRPVVADVVKQLLCVEQEFGIDRDHLWRGVLVAAAYVETGGTFHREALGDGGRALGVLQLHEPWYRDVDRTNPTESGRAYLTNVLYLRTAKSRPYRRCKHAFWVAEYAAAKGRFGGCLARSRHFRVWQWLSRKAAKLMESERFVSCVEEGC